MNILNTLSKRAHILSTISHGPVTGGGSQRHTGQDIDRLINRRAVYEAAKMRHPKRWIGNIRNWDHIGDVHLNLVKGKKKIVESQAA